MGNRADRDGYEKSALYRFASVLDRTVNLIGFILFILLLLYAGHSLWYNHSMQNDSFLSDELAQHRPDGREPSLAELKKLNPDVTAWLTIDGTNIDYPVVQGRDDSEYLNKSALGEFSLAGAIFLSATNKADFSDSYNMLHGHHIEGGAMFADVIEFRNASFFNTHTRGTLWYPSADGMAKADRIEIFAAVQAEGIDPIIYGDPSNVTPEILTEVTDYVLGKSVQKRDIVIDKSTRIIAMSTCEDAVSFERALIFGKLTTMTDAEIAEALKAFEDEQGSTTSSKGFFATLASWPPWILPSIGACLFLLLIYLLSRIHKDKKERRERYKRQA